MAQAYYDSYQHLPARTQNRHCLQSVEHISQFLLLFFGSAIGIDAYVAIGFLAFFLCLRSVGWAMRELCQNIHVDSNKK